MGTADKMEKGYLAVVLHAHLPFVRHPECEDALEENWLYEAITEVYLPLLLVLDGLLDEAIDFRLTLSLTPTLVSMLQDPLLQARYLRRIERLIELAKKETVRTVAQPEFHALARRYHQRFRQARDAFLNRYQGDLVQAFRRLQARGKVEIMASAATHAYFPVLAVNPAAVRAQVRIGIEHYEAVFGRKPKGFWLPECGYYPGVDHLLREQGIRFTILDTHGITHAEPKPGYGVYAPVYSPSGLAVFGRDPDSSRQVWSSVEGYPGDPNYREFYRDIAYDLEADYLKPCIHPDGMRIDSGIKYYRITGKTDRKEVYVPERAESQAVLHAVDFVTSRARQLEYLVSRMDRKPIVVAPYDAELFGHWWYEGPVWLDHLIRQVARRRNAIRLITLSEYLSEYEANQVATPAGSSWGYKGFSDTWVNGRNDWVYPPLHQAAQVMEKLAESNPRAQGLTLRALNQAGRELMLAQASDWAFMISAGTTVGYGTSRTKMHLARLDQLRRQIQGGTIDKAWLSAVESQDNIFSFLNVYRAFRRQPYGACNERASSRRPRTAARSTQGLCAAGAQRKTRSQRSSLGSKAEQAREAPRRGAASAQTELVPVGTQ